MANQKILDCQTDGHPKQHKNGLFKSESKFPNEAPTIIPETESGKVRKRAAEIQALIFVINCILENKNTVKKRLCQFLKHNTIQIVFLF